ncbi:ATP-grasp domain-containing protein [Dactylosporangium sp. CA-152071]|uniref:ATP-grasp domain-containing protein n=1 Tax=Dactylosporangium sp. CA-152071 TaxID=3239933 RepID=UPI003D8C5173
MAGTALDLTGPRAGAGIPVYAVYGDLHPAATMTELLAGGVHLRQLGPDHLIPVEAGLPHAAQQLLDMLAHHNGRPLAGVVGFDDWWTVALAALNPAFPLAAARQLVTDKAALYTTLTANGVPAPPHLTGPLDHDLLTSALDRFGAALILKPATGAGSRGVFRYRTDLTIGENIAVYQRLRALGHIDSSVPTIACPYLGGDDALEISVDAIVCAGNVRHAVVHEKCTATRQEPFVDQIMLTPPVQPQIVAALPGLPAVTAGIVATLQLHDGTLHTELRLHDGVWHVLDIGVRPGSGLVSHAVQALTGTDPRAVHLAASLGRPLPADVIRSRTPRFAAAAIACCYLADERRDAVDLAEQADLAHHLRHDPAVIGWHLNTAELDDQVYRPDAGLSIGVAAATPTEASKRLQSLVAPYGYTTP